MSILSKIVALFAKKDPIESDQVLNKFYEFYNSLEGNKKNINLNELASNIRSEDRGEQNLSLTDVKEIIGILGDRWRNMHSQEFLDEVVAIYNRAGINRQNK